MSNVLWIPKQKRTQVWERPYLQIPAPMEYMPQERPSSADIEEEKDSPRVIIIDI